MLSRRYSLAMVLGAALLLVSMPIVLMPSADEKLIYLDSSQLVEKRIEDLLARMTLSEKIGQMNMPCVYEEGLGRDDQSKFDGVRKFTEGTYVQEIGPAGGFFTLANTILHQGARQQATFSMSSRGSRWKKPD